VVGVSLSLMRIWAIGEHFQSAERGRPARP